MSDHKILPFSRPRRGETRIARRPMAPGRLGGRMEFDGRIVVLLADDVPEQLVAAAVQHLYQRHRERLGDGHMMGLCDRECGAASTFRRQILTFRRPAHA